MAFWNPDLTTEDGALGAAQIGAYACFIAAALAALGLFLLFGMLRNGTVPIIFGAGMIVEIGIFIVAGLRLRVGQGFWLGMGAAALLVLELIGKLMSFSIGGLVINAILLVGVVTGIRGATALRLGRFDQQDAA